MAYNPNYKPYDRANAAPLPKVSRESVLQGFKPSAEQQAIFDFFLKGQGDLIIDAKAGSGKTTSLKQLIARLFSNSIIYCVFSKAVEAEVKPQLNGLCEVKTTYSIGRSILYKHFGDKMRAAGNASMDKDKYSKLCRMQANLLYSQLSMKAGFGKSGDALAAALSTVPKAKAIKNALEALVNALQMNLVEPYDFIAVEDLVYHHSIDLPLMLIDLLPIVAAILEQGKLMLTQQGIISFSDMVWLPCVLNLTAPTLYHYILVDEAQDINKAQRTLLYKLRAQGGRFGWVGDKRQAIFGFAGADASSFASIKTETGASELPLNTCYRCPKSAIRLAQEIVPDIMPAPDAPEGLLSSIRRDALTSAVQVGDMVLCRTTAPLVTECLKMIARGIPARLRGSDMAKSIIAFIEQVADANGFEYRRFTEYLDKHVTALVERLSANEDNADQIEALLDKAEAVKVCFLNYTDCFSVDQLSRKIEELFTDDEAGIILSSVHRSKGLEAERIFILCPEKLPNTRPNMKDWEYEQEMNLRYVALTRVKFNRKTGFAGALYFVEG